MRGERERRRGTEREAYGYQRKGEGDGERVNISWKNISLSTFDSDVCVLRVDTE